jgi:hypothetical protein
MTTIDELAARVARLEEHQGLATRADVVDVRRDIADQATGIGTDLRTMRGDIADMRTELVTIRRLLERSRFRWPW